MFFVVSLDIEKRVQKALSLKPCLKKRGSCTSIITVCMEQLSEATKVVTGIMI